ncbi:MAG: hypothetical protein HYT79_07215 [Elusimicrobia bacterium]|nr:hypothetical protein [Elusimicrobiota bacterium]
MRAYEQHEPFMTSRMESPVAYYLTCGGDRAGFRPVSGPDPVGRRQTTAPVDSPGSGTATPGADEAYLEAFRQAIETARNRSSADLTTFVRNSGHCDINPNGRVFTVDGVNLFSETEDPARVQAAWDALSLEEAASLKVLYDQVVQQAIYETKETEGPPPPGHFFHFNPDSGQVDIEFVEESDFLKDEPPAATPGQ